MIGYVVLSGCEIQIKEGQEWNDEEVVWI